MMSERSQTAPVVLPLPINLRLLTVTSWAGERGDREYITRVLERMGGNKARTAQILGIDRKTLYRKLDDSKETAPQDPNETAT
jgi:DNA-binding NtrC family response regulator